MAASNLRQGVSSGLRLIVLITLLSGCARTPISPTLDATPLAVHPKPSQTPAPTQTESPTTAPTRQATATAVPFQVCSPLQGIPLAELGEILTTSFNPPAPGLDDGHHGTDFAFYTRGDLHEMIGLPIQSVLDGVIAGAVHDLPPYGNMLIVETRLADLPPAWVTNLDPPLPGPTPPSNPRLQCPNSPEEEFASSGRSIYILYAHMNQAPAQDLGEPVACGQQIGEVGNSGASGNPHLHIEVRVGPSGARWDEMAHYSNAATDQEMHNYCQWRISGQFQMMDPMTLLSTSP